MLNNRDNDRAIHISTRILHIITSHWCGDIERGRKSELELNYKCNKRKILTIKFKPI